MSKQTKKLLTVSWFGSLCKHNIILLRIKWQLARKYKNHVFQKDGASWIQTSSNFFDWAY